MNITEQGDTTGKPVQIADGVYRIGARQKNGQMDCYTYLSRMETRAF
jgi:hypothetical protein